MLGAGVTSNRSNQDVGWRQPTNFELWRLSLRNKWPRESGACRCAVGADQRVAQPASYKMQDQAAPKAAAYDATLENTRFCVLISSWTCWQSRQPSFPAGHAGCS